MHWFHQPKISSSKKVTILIIVFFPSLQSLSRSSSGISVLNGTPTCRICQTSRSADDINGQESLVSPCDCRGSLGFVHKSCMEKWLNLRNKDTCELCHFKFNTKRKFRPLHKVSIVFIANNGISSPFRCNVVYPHIFKI